MTVKPLTEEEQKSWPKEPLVALEVPFADARGRIQPLVDLMMESAFLIESTKGSLRANHYHKCPSGDFMSRMNRLSGGPS